MDLQKFLRCVLTQGTEGVVMHPRWFVHLFDKSLRGGETPFLRLYRDNTIAAALYTKLGFALQRRLIVTVLRRAN